MSRLFGALTAACLSVLLLSACGTAQRSAPQPSPSPDSRQKLDAALTAKLPQLQADQSIRVVAMLEPGVSTEQLRDALGRLDGKLVDRLTIIEAAVVELPARNVVSLAALPQVKRLELDDTGVPPPSTR